jgi:diacylglycerol kinase family enzyme
VPRHARGRLVNPSSGSDKAPGDAVQALFPGHRIVVCEAKDIPSGVAEAVKDGVDFVAVAGGDGTLRCAAEPLVGTGVPFLPIPAGTRNHFALGRERDEHRMPKVLAQLAAVWGQIRHGHRFSVRVGPERYRAWLLFVGNGRYGEGLADLADRETVEVALDGEVERFEPPLRYRVRPQALTVLVPPETHPETHPESG